jgi:predicted nucleic acid-binding protein
LALVFWDTNLFVYLFDGSPEFGASVRELGRRMEARKDRLVTSALTIGEILVRPIREKDSDTERRYQAFFSDPEIQIAAFDANAAQVYARVRQDAAIRVADAIQLACAASAKVDLFITNDERLSRKNIPGINFVTSLARAPI